MSASNYLENAILQYFLRGQNIAQPTGLYLALYTTNPTDNDTGTEVAGGGYSRQPIGFDVPTQQSGRATIKNSADVPYETATNNWGEIPYWGIRDAKTGGNLLAYGAFNKPHKIDVGNRFILERGNLTVDVE